VHAQTAEASGFTHMQSTLLPVASGLTEPLPPRPTAMYDEQLGITFTQNFVSLAYNVTAVPQADSDGYGPAYLLNGLSNDGAWYQVGLSYNWPYTGGYVSGFNFNYEVFDSAGNSIYPTNGGGGLESFSGTINSGDLVTLELYFNNGIVYMSAKDLNTGAVANANYTDSHTTEFLGLSSPSNGHGFFSGLMTEWYHVNPYYGDEAEVTYSDNSFNLSSAWMWMDEWQPPNGPTQFYSYIKVTYLSNPTQLQSLSSNGTTEFSNTYQFITGSIVNQMTSITLLPAGGSTSLSVTNEFAVSFTLDGYPQVSYAQNGTLTFTADSGTNVVIFGVSTGSSLTEEWVLNSQEANVTVPAGSTTTFYYYDILSQQVAYEISGGGNPSSPTLTYFTAPSAASAQFNQTIDTISLPLIQQTVMVLRGTSATVSNNILGISQDQWATSISSWSISQVNQIPSPIIYYHQYQVIASYSTSDGSVPSSNLILSGTQYGSNYQLLLITTNQATWLDANTTWSTPTIATAISGTEQWVATGVTSGNVSEATTVDPVYYDQYQVTFFVSPSGTGSTSPVGTNVWENAGSLSITATPSVDYAFSSWLSNTGSITFNNANSASATATISGTGTIIATFTINMYTITVTQTANGVIAPGTTAVNSGGSQTFTITPNTGYYIVDVTVDESSVGAVSSYTFTNVQASYTISATFAPTSTSTPTPTATPTPVPTTPIPTAIPASTPAPSPTPIPSATTVSPNPAQSKSLPQDAIYGIAAAVSIVVIVAVVLVLRKSKKAVYA
jgi:hypothetical protein